MINIDHGHGILAVVSTAPGELADINPMLTQQGANTPNDSRHILVLDNDQDALGGGVEVLVIISTIRGVVGAKSVPLTLFILPFSICASTVIKLVY